MNSDERRQFVRDHRTAIFGYNGREHGPAMTVVYYVMDGDELLISTMAARGKAKAVRRDGLVSLCVLDENWPVRYLQVYGTAIVEDDRNLAVDVLCRVVDLMAGETMPASTLPDLERMVRDEGGIVLRVTPYATFETPPRHVYHAMTSRPSPTSRAATSHGETGTSTSATPALIILTGTGDRDQTALQHQRQLRHRRRLSARSTTQLGRATGRAHAGAGHELLPARYRRPEYHPPCGEEVAPAVRDIVATERAAPTRTRSSAERVELAPATAIAGEWAAKPTPDDGTRRGTESLWDESTRPAGPARTRSVATPPPNRPPAST